MSKKIKQFIDLTLELQKELYQNVDEEMKGTYRQQRIDLDKLLNEVARIIMSEEVVENELQLSMFDKKNIKKKVYEKINNIAEEQRVNEQLTIEEILTNTTIDKYYSNGYLLDIGVDFNLKRLKSKQIKQIVDAKIKGELWSRRLWKNKKKLEKNLRKEISRLLDGKTNINKIEKLIKDKFNQNAYNTKRLISTEIARCQNAANEIFAEEHGVKTQMFMATLDDRTSEVCQGHDGEVFDIDDKNKPQVPLHPNCRSVLINMPSAEWRPSARKDNITKEYVDYQTYQEWRDNNVQ